MIFTFFLNVYRQYKITGEETGLFSEDQYESLDFLIRKTSKSPKAKIFWENNKDQFKSLNFVEWMDKKFFNKN